MSGLDAGLGVLVVVDVQQKLVPAIEDHEAVVARAAILVKAAVILSIPVIFTEHFPEKIGATVAALTDLSPGATVFRKEHFDACEEPSFASVVAGTGRRQAIVCGTEAHVCAMQTAIGLNDLGYEVYCVDDAMGSRKARDRQAGINRLTLEGIMPLTSEMIVFEWAGRGGTDTFKALLALIK